MEIRLQKFLAQAGVASRRASEELILAGKVAVNGQTVTKLGTKIDPEKDLVTVNKKVIKVEKQKFYIALNKPAGYITSLKDPQGRKKVTDLLKDIQVRIYPVGRLDYETEGLLLLTNDGDFAYNLTHPKHKIKKTYLAQVQGIPSENDLQKLRTGIMLSDGPTATAEVSLLKKGKNTATIKITIHEGRNRQVRRMFEAINHPVLHLKRVRIGNLDLGALKVGEYRFLTPLEVQSLLKMSTNSDKP